MQIVIYSLNDVVTKFIYWKKIVIDTLNEEPRQYGTKTFRHPLKKTVRHQDKSAPHFLSNKRDYLLYNKITES